MTSFREVIFLKNILVGGGLVRVKYSVELLLPPCGKLEVLQIHSINHQGCRRCRYVSFKFNLNRFGRILKGSFTVLHKFLLAGWNMKCDMLHSRGWKAERFVIVDNSIHHLSSSIGGMLASTVMQKSNPSSAFLIQHTHKRPHTSLRPTNAVQCLSQCWCGMLHHWLLPVVDAIGHENTHVDHVTSVPRAAENKRFLLFYIWE